MYFDFQAIFFMYSRQGAHKKIYRLLILKTRQNAQLANLSNI